jgi:hypothetical protein
VKSESDDESDAMIGQCRHGNVGEGDRTGIPPHCEWEAYINKGGLHRVVVQMYAGLALAGTVNISVVFNASESTCEKEMMPEFEDGGYLCGNTPYLNLCMGPTRS